MGFDDVQFDYVRFPTDGNVHGAIYSLPNTAENRIAAITGLLNTAHAALAPYNVNFGVDIFGYPPWVNDDVGIGQQIEALAPYVDYLRRWSTRRRSDRAARRGPQIRQRHRLPVCHRSQEHRPGGQRARAVNPAVEIRPWLQDFGDYAFDYRAYTPGEIRPDGRATGGRRPRVDAVGSGGASYSPEALVSPNRASTPNPAGKVLVLAFRDFAPAGEPAAAGALTPEQSAETCQALYAAGFYPVNLRDMYRKAEHRAGGQTAGGAHVRRFAARQFRLPPMARRIPRAPSVCCWPSTPRTRPIGRCAPHSSCSAIFRRPGRRRSLRDSRNRGKKVRLLADWGMEIGVKPAGQTRLARTGG